MQQGSAGCDLLSPYASWAEARPDAREAMALFGGRACGWRTGWAGYAGVGDVRRWVWRAETRVERPPKEEDMVLNSTCLMVFVGASSM